MAQDKYFRKELVKELRNVEGLMKKEPSLEKKIYYFSAAFGATGRTFRYAFSRDVLLADFTLQAAYNLFTDRINRIKAGDPTVKIEDVHIKKLCEGLKLLAKQLEAEECIQESLELILTTAFSITGPGNYLHEKGDLKL